MAAYERSQISTLFDRLREKPWRLAIVTGPRQTGKTTLVHQVLGRLDGPSRYVSVDEPNTAILPPIPVLGGSQPEFAEQQSALLDGPRDARWLVLQWEQARVEAEGSDRGFVLAIDEIQRIPNWSETVKGLWDADRRLDRPLHVILLISAPMLMQQGLSESLAGRFETVRLMHWSFAEMSAAFGFDLQRFVYFGGYPGSAPLIPEQSRWRAYIAEALVEPNIERDILAMQRVDKPALLKRLFQLGAEYSGQILSFNKMLGQLQDA
ncbi:MAG: AAA family ATPase, partial [Albidovulum sp.]|nr:AAA family ATPase [Albidovulum sp.]